MICDQQTCARCGKDLFQNEAEKWDFDTKWDLIQIMLWSPNGNDFSEWHHISLCKECRKKKKKWIKFDASLALSVLAEGK